MRKKAQDKALKKFQQSMDRALFGSQEKLLSGIAIEKGYLKRFKGQAENAEKWAEWYLYIIDKNVKILQGLDKKGYEGFPKLMSQRVKNIDDLLHLKGVYEILEKEIDKFGKDKIIEARRELNLGPEDFWKKIEESKKKGD